VLVLAFDRSLGPKTYLFRRRVVFRLAVDFLAVDLRRVVFRLAGFRLAVDFLAVLLRLFTAISSILINIKHKY